VLLKTPKPQNKIVFGMKKKEEEQKGGEREIVLIGLTGSGKSTLGNRILSLSGSQVFGESDATERCTTKTERKIGYWCKTPCGVMDTPGLNDSKEQDAAHIRDLAGFVNGNLNHGLTCFLFVINGQEPRFAHSLRKVFLRYLYMCKSEEFWTHFAIVFTRCYPEVKMDKEKRRVGFTKCICEEYRSLYGKECLLPVPCFFVDSPNHKDPETKAQLDLLYRWMLSLNPMEKAYMSPDRQPKSEPVPTKSFWNKVWEFLTPPRDSGGDYYDQCGMG
jgi:AIG1 family